MHVLVCTVLCIMRPRDIYIYSTVLYIWYVPSLEGTRYIRIYLYGMYPPGRVRDIVWLNTLLDACPGSTRGSTWSFHVAKQLPGAVAPGFMCTTSFQQKLRYIGSSQVSSAHCLLNHTQQRGSHLAQHTTKFNAQQEISTEDLPRPLPCGTSVSAPCTPALPGSSASSTVCFHIIRNLETTHDWDLPTFSIRALRIIWKRTRTYEYTPVPRSVSVYSLEISS